MKTIKKMIRSHFLFFAEKPGEKTFLILCALLLVGLILFSVLAGPGDMPKDWIEKKLTLSMLFGGGIPLLNLILVLSVRERFITIPPKTSRYDSAFLQIIHQTKHGQVAVKQKGEKIIIDEPVWAKGIIYQLKTEDAQSAWYNKENPEGSEENIEVSVLRVNTKVSGKYRNSVITIPVWIHIHTNAKKFFNPIEVFKKIAGEDPESETLFLPRYIREVFEKINQKNQPEIQRLITEYVEMKISESVLIGEVIDLLIFPERPFSNVENVQICLGAPTTSSCKGMVCGK